MYSLGGGRIKEWGNARQRGGWTQLKPYFSPAPSAPAKSGVDLNNMVEDGTVFYLFTSRTQLGKMASEGGWTREFGKRLQGGWTLKKSARFAHRGGVDAIKGRGGECVYPSFYHRPQTFLNIYIYLGGIGGVGAQSCRPNTVGVTWGAKRG